MKKLIWLSLGVIFSAFILLFKTPILTTNEALLKTEEYLNNPPEDSHSFQMNVVIEELPPEQITVQLTDQTGVFNKIFNRKQWIITIKLQDKEPSVVIDAHNGNLIGFFGPFS